MAEPKMLTSVELSKMRAQVAALMRDGNGEARVVRVKRAGALLSHIAAQDAAIAAKDAEIAKLRAAVMAADRLLIFAESGQDGDVCNICCARTDGPHVEDCDVPAYRTARAAVKLEGDDAKG